MFTYKKDNFKVPVKVWMGEEEYYKDMLMVQQVENVAQLPFAFHHIALSPDGHVGYGAPIGGILAAENVIVPNFVGLDIGCGMCAVKTSLTEIDKDMLKKIMGEIRTAVPVGFTHHKTKQDVSLMPKIDDYVYSFKTIVSEEFENARTQIGTLGGGNHFIEIQKGSDGYIWIMIHSGSRNLGLKTANLYNRLAVGLNDVWKVQVPPEQELAYFPADIDEGLSYIGDMNYCVEFALSNRKLMMDRVFGIMATLTNAKNLQFINIAHNYARLENHFGKNVWIHRKGATLATEDTIGIIPGSQGTKSYIVKGKGNIESFKSCSHGAGRKMGRRQAQKTLNLEEEKKKLDDQGIIHSIRGVQDLDEAPGSYKSIDEVMKNQLDLVDVQVELSPLAVIKG